MSRTSCRENGRINLLGYFRGVRDWFPEGSFEESRLAQKSAIQSSGSGICHGSCMGEDPRYVSNGPMTQAQWARMNHERWLELVAEHRGAAQAYARRYGLPVVEPPPFRDPPPPKPKPEPRPAPRQIFRAPVMDPPPKPPRTVLVRGVLRRRPPIRRPLLPVQIVAGWPDLECSGDPIFG